MEFSVMPNVSLARLCVDHGWFTLGSNDRYRKLFYANENGFSIGQIASMIWLLSDVNIHSWHDIFYLLCEEHEKYCSSLELDLVRR